MTSRPAEQILYNYGYFFQSHIGTIRRDRDYSPCSDPQISKPRNPPQRVRGPSPSLGNLYQEVELPRHLALKTSGAYIWERQRVGGNQGCAFSESWRRGSSLKSTELLVKVTHWLILEGTGICWNFLLSCKWGWVPFLSPFFTLLPPTWSDAGRHHFWHSPFTLLTLFTPSWHFPEDSPRLAPLQCGSCPATPGGRRQLVHSSVSATVKLEPCGHSHQRHTSPAHQCARNSCGQSTQPAGPGTRVACWCVHCHCGPTTTGGHASPPSEALWSTWPHRISSK